MAIDGFTTDRLSVRHWQTVLADPEDRERLEADLSAMLSDKVLEHLPPPLHITDSITSWVNDRAGESDVLLIEMKDKNLVGLLILAAIPGDEILTVHIGYLLSEVTWGQGIASELVAGLVAAMDGKRPVRLIGGVDTGNPASARVLQKAGFTVDPSLSQPGHEMYVLTLT